MQTQNLASMASKNAAYTWRIDPDHTSADYTIRHMFTRFRGVFRAVSGTIEFDPARPELARISARIDLTALDTGLPDRDAHLKGGDFFDVDDHPYMNFESDRVEPVGGDNYRLHGALTIRGITRPVSFDVEFLGDGPDAWGGHRAGAIARGRIARKDFGMVWNAALDRGGIVLGDDVNIELHVEAIRAL